MTTYLGKELFILFAASAFRKLSSIYVFSYFPFGFEGRIWDLIVSVPDHCLSFYFRMKICSNVPGHMAKMASRLIYGKNLEKKSSSEPRSR